MSFIKNNMSEDIEWLNTIDTELTVCSLLELKANYFQETLLNFKWIQV